jgi:hypothetical protein
MLVPHTGRSSAQHSVVGQPKLPALNLLRVLVCRSRHVQARRREGGPKTHRLPLFDKPNIRPMALQCSIAGRTLRPALGRAARRRRAGHLDTRPMTRRPLAILPCYWPIISLFGLESECGYSTILSLPWSSRSTDLRRQLHSNTPLVYVDVRNRRPQQNKNVYRG